MHGILRHVFRSVFSYSWLRDHSCVMWLPAEMVQYLVLHQLTSSQLFVWNCPSQCNIYDLFSNVPSDEEEEDDDNAESAADGSTQRRPRPRNRTVSNTCFRSACAELVFENRRGFGPYCLTFPSLKRDIATYQESKNMGTVMNCLTLSLTLRQ